MGSVSKAIGNAAVGAGAHIVTDAEVCCQESLLTLKLASSIVSTEQFSHSKQILIGLCPYSIGSLNTTRK